MTPSFPALETTPTIDELVSRGAPVAIGVSGGKDSTVVTGETLAYLDRMGHSGPRVLMHSDLGRVEWKDSLPACERLARRYGLELVVVRREKGDLLDRWLTRWHTNCERYVQLQCVKLILPWSTASMRFCTSELKTAIICRDLVKRYPQRVMLSVSGIRRQESATRALAPVAAPQAKLTSVTWGTSGYDWHPLLAWSLEDVLTYHQVHQLPLHEAYTRYGTTRVSCAFCILSSLHDLMHSATCPENHAIYRELVELEIASTFGFQESRWLGDVAPHLLTADAQRRLKEAQQRARQREAIEVRIPSHLLYRKGWPQILPTWAEACLLGTVRMQVAEIMELPVRYTDPQAIVDRYAELMALQALRGPMASSPVVRPMQPGLWPVEVCL